MYTLYYESVAYENIQFRSIQSNVLTAKFGESCFNRIADRKICNSVNFLQIKNCRNECKIVYPMPLQPQITLEIYA